MSEQLRIVLTVYDGDQIYQAEKVAPPEIVLPGPESPDIVGTTARGLLIAALAQEAAAQIRRDLEHSHTDR